MLMTQISNIEVPFSGDPKSKIYLLGEAPGADEERLGEPFVGKAGDTLNNILMTKNIKREDCFLCNLSKFRPKDNRFSYLIGSAQLRHGIEEVGNLILTNKPNLVVLLGNNPLEFMLDLPDASIHAYRGSILSYGGVKCIPTFHPSYINRHTTNPIDIAIWDMDWDRIKEESLHPRLDHPVYNFIFEPTDILIDDYCKEPYLAIDIETVRESTEIISIAFARSDKDAIAFLYNKNSGYGLDNVHKLLTSNAVKIFHNGIFDALVLLENGHSISNYTEDTIIQAHVLEPQFPRDLGYLSSIWTRQPYYKKSGRANIPLDNKGWSRKTSENKQRLLTYNAIDSVVTYKVWKGQKEYIDEDPFFSKTYKFEMEMQEVAIEFSKNGFLVDLERQGLLKKEIDRDWAYNQVLLEALTRKPLNVNSGVQLQKYLYDDLGLPVKTKKNKKGETVRTADDDAVISLLNYTKQHIDDVKKASTKREWQIKYHILDLINRIKGIMKRRSSYIDITPSEDNRARGTHKVPGAETGRWSVSKYVDNTGVPLQTIPRD